jgi:hypothetical protein
MISRYKARAGRADISDNVTFLYFRTSRVKTRGARGLGYEVLHILTQLAGIASLSLYLLITSFSSGPACRSYAATTKWSSPRPACMTVSVLASRSATCVRRTSNVFKVERVLKVHEGYSQRSSETSATNSDYTFDLRGLSQAVSKQRRHLPKDGVWGEATCNGESSPQRRRLAPHQPTVLDWLDKRLKGSLLRLCRGRMHDQHNNIKSSMIPK